MSLIKTLNSRYSIAKSFTKKFHDEIERNIDDYEAVTPSDGKLGKKNGVYNRHITSSRYNMTVPYIFATHESMTAGFFENMPDIVINGRTANSDKVQIVKAVYEYLKDKADLDEFLGVSAWWFFLVGMVKADVEFKTEIESYAPQLDSAGNPMTNEEGEPVDIPVYAFNDPVATVENPLKVYFSPDSEFSIDGKQIPYYIKERLVEVDEIKEVYKVEVEGDEQLEVDDISDKEVENDLKRAKVMYYYGTLPSSVKDELKQKFDLFWTYTTNYKAYFTKDTILLAEEIAEKPCKLARLYTSMNKFFGFGIAKTLRPFQEDMSIRRSQQLAYADRFAYPWLTLPNGVKVDQKNLMDYEKKTPLPYSSDNGAKPEYLSPPQMPSVVTDADNAVRGDAQFVSGTLDLSKGAQQTNTVKTATGQQLFAQSQDKRLNKARKSLAKYYREVVIQMFKLARDNWNEDEKHITYMSDEGESQDLTVTAESLKDIDFDTDIDFNLDSVSVNKDTESQRWLSLLETTADLEFADREKIFSKVLKESFRVENPESYIKAPEEQMNPNMPPADPTAPPIENPESLPDDQTLGQEMAPDAQFSGGM
jgi:hypothetical protein